MCNTYRLLKKNQYYIDKTAALEKRIAVFPSVYIEGGAASGKTTAVKMLISKHKETACIVFDMKKYQSEEEMFCQKLTECMEKMSLGPCWVIFEDIHAGNLKELGEYIKDFVLKLPENGRAVFISREKPPEAFLDLLWKQQMTLLRQQSLLFSPDEVQDFTAHMGCTLDASDVYGKTGGWAGGVSLMVSLAVMDVSEGGMPKSAEEYVCSYEMRTYIQKEIMDTLGSEEKAVLLAAGICPWVDAKLCKEIWRIHDPEKVIDSLMCKGLLVYDDRYGRWRLAPILRFSGMGDGRCIGEYSGSSENISTSDMTEENANTEDSESMKSMQLWSTLGRWYEQNGYVRETVYCLKRSKDQKLCRGCMIKYFDRIPYSGIEFGEVMQWQEDEPELCYLRGMYCYIHQDFSGLDREIKKVEDYPLCREIYINLLYVFPDKTLDEWLAELEKSAVGGKKLRLYHMLGNSPMALCGLRDLAGMFACPAKEEKRKAEIWKECLTDDAWKVYQLARMDFYMETLRIDAISEEDREVLFGSTLDHETWQISLARLYLLCKYQKIRPEEDNYLRIRQLEKNLMAQQNEVCGKITEAVSDLYALRQGETERLTQRLRRLGPGAEQDVNETNFAVLYCRAKDYLLMNQYDRAKKLMRQLIPYVKNFRRNRFAAELLFQSAVVSIADKNHRQMLHSTIESFLICGASHYVDFYTGYGKKGTEVIENYITWVQSNSQEGWRHKKKYNYGNVVRMPQEDYLDAVLRSARREIRVNSKVQEPAVEEKLTMMETIVLQNIGQGMTNAQICQILNLKMTTVKSHVYNVYKKLGVNSRVQAVLKGREMGIIQ